MLPRSTSGKGEQIMIYTVTFNPAIDYVVHPAQVVLGEVNRSSAEEIYFGGKGINVSAVLKELGFRSKALGFTAGFTGEAIERGVAAMGVDADFVRLKNGSSRINVKINSAEETEINCQGPDIDSDALDELFDKLDKVGEGDLMVLAGSIPKSLPADIYERILARISGRGVKSAVDATGALLMNVLKYQPFLVKPNNFELGELFGVKLNSLTDIEKYARKLREMGARNVLVSMAGDGALLVDEFDEVHRCGVCKRKVVNSVGAGDSMVAGFIAGVLSQEISADSQPIDYSFALKLGTAAGGATAFSSGLAKKDLIDTLIKTL